MTINNLSMCVGSKDLSDRYSTSLSLFSNVQISRQWLQVVILNVVHLIAVSLLGTNYDVPVRTSVKDCTGKLQVSRPHFKSQ